MKNTKHLAIIGWTWICVCCLVCIFAALNAAESSLWAMLPIGIIAIASTMRLGQLEYRYRNTLESTAAINFLLPWKVLGRYWWAVALRGILTLALAIICLLGVGLLTGASWEGLMLTVICAGSIIILRKDRAIILDGPDDYQEQLILHRIQKELLVSAQDLDEVKIETLRQLQNKRYRIFALHDMAHPNAAVLPQLMRKLESNDDNDILYRLFSYGIIFSRSGWSLEKALSYIESLFPLEKPKSLPEVFEVVIYAYLATTDDEGLWILLPGVAKLVPQAALEGLPTPGQCVEVLEKCLSHHIGITERPFNFPGLMMMKARQNAKQLVACAK